MRKKRVRERDVCFMSKEWKAAIRNKRKYAIQFAKDGTPETLNLKRNIEILLLVNEGKLLLHTGTKSLKK